MADAKKCDRCKKFYQVNDEFFYEALNVYPINGMRLTYYLGVGNPHVSDGVIDLCDDCISDLRDFLGESFMDIMISKRVKEYKEKK